MGRLIFYSLILLIAIIIGLLIQTDSGYVLLSYRQWTVETSLWFFVLALFLLFISIHYVLVFLRFLQDVPSRWSRRKQQRTFEKSSIKLNEGLLALMSGQWGQAECLLIQAARKTLRPVVHYLAAAYAAQKQNSTRRRDSYLAKAYKNADSQALAVSIARIQFQMDQHEYEKALPDVEKLYERFPKNDLVLELLITLYEKQERWHDLLALIPQLKQRKFLDQNETDLLLIKIYKNLFQEYSHDLEKLKNLWMIVPKNLYMNAQLLISFCKILVSFGESEQALKLISDRLKKNWNDELCDYYGRIASKDVDKPLHLLESWLKQRPHDSVLLLSLGRIAIRKNDWSLAEKYLQKSLEINETEATLTALAYVYEHKGNMPKVIEIYHKILGSMLD